MHQHLKQAETDTKERIPSITWEQLVTIICLQKKHLLLEACPTRPTSYHTKRVDLDLLENPFYFFLLTQKY